MECSRLRTADYISKNRDEHNARRQAARRANPEKTKQDTRRAHQAQWAKKRDIILARCRRWKQENPEKARAAVASWKARHKDRVRELNAASYRRRAKACKKARQRWARNNPDKIRAYTLNRLAKKKLALGNFTKADIDRIWLAQRKKCAGCRIRLRRSECTTDHITPLSRGGSNYPHNLQILCGPCNSSKGPLDPIEFMQRKGLLL